MKINMKNIALGIIVIVILLSLSSMTLAAGQRGAFLRTLKRGAAGADVQALQKFLKTPPSGGGDIYPEGLVNGRFGVLTEKAVRRFQAKYGIEPVGVVDMKTRAKLNELLAGAGAPTMPVRQASSSAKLPECASSTATNCRKTARTDMFDPSGGKCQGKGPVLFGASPFKLDQIEIIEPMGQMVGGHVTPIDHGYIFGKGTPNVAFDSFDIQSPAKGYVVEISRTQRGNLSDYALTIEFSCTFYVHYSNMSSFAPKLMAAAKGSVGENETKAMRVPVDEGELVGRTGPYGIDLYVWDLNVNLSGYVNPKTYASEGWKLHSAQFYDYLKEPLRTELLDKTPRRATPRFGKIDYDIDGKLVGNWFQEGTNGYAGLNRGKEGYWAGHLAIVYDALDPSGIIISIGDWNGEAKQFGVRGNAPDPKDVGVNTGLVSYELLQPDWAIAATGEHWDRRHYVKEAKFKPIDTAPNAIQGVILVQLIEPRKLKVELFPGKTATQVSGFTEQAKLYAR